MKLMKTQLLDITEVDRQINKNFVEIFNRLQVRVNFC